MQNFWAKVKDFFRNPENRYKVLLGAIGAVVLVTAVFFSTEIGNLFKIFRPRAAVEENLTWQSENSLIGNRSDAASVQVKIGGTNYLYVLGGFIKSGNQFEFLNSVERAELDNSGNITSNGWQQAPAMLSTRAGLRAVAYDAGGDGNDDFIYAVAGDFHEPPSGEFGPWQVGGSDQGLGLNTYLADKTDNDPYTEEQWQQLINAGMVWVWKGTGEIQQWEANGPDYISGGSAENPWINASNYSLKADDWIAIKLGGTEGPGEPLPYSTVERLNLNTNQWEPVARLLDVNYYPEVAIFNGKLHITGGIYGNFFEAGIFDGGYSFGWGSLGGLTPEPTGNGGTETGTETGGGGSGTGAETGAGGTEASPIGFLSRILSSGRALAAEAETQEELNFWFEFQKTGAPVGSGNLYLYKNIIPVWENQKWVEKRVYEEEHYEYRIGKIVTPGGRTIYFFYRVYVPEASTYIAHYPAPNPSFVYSDALASGKFVTTSSIYYAYDLVSGTWPVIGELPDDTAYSNSPGYTSFDNLDGRLVKNGTIRLKVSSWGGDTSPPYVWLGPVAQGRYGHQLVEFNDNLYIFGGASVGSGYTGVSWNDYVYGSESPFWVIDNKGHPWHTKDNCVPTNVYQYRTSITLTWGGDWWNKTPLLAFKDAAGFSQGRAFHTIARLNDDSGNYLLSAGGLVNSGVMGMEGFGTPIIASTSQVEQLNRPGTGWGNAPNLPMSTYSLTAVSVGSRAVFAGGVGVFPFKYSADNYWPNYGAAPAGATYIWDGQGWDTLSTQMVNHDDLLQYAWTPVTTEDIYNKYFSLYLAGGLGNGIASQSVERFGPMVTGIPAELSFAYSGISVTPRSIPADGEAQATITVSLRDSRGDPITDGYQVRVFSTLPPYVESSDYHGYNGRNAFYDRTVDVIASNSWQSIDASGQATFTIQSTQASSPGWVYLRFEVKDSRGQILEPPEVYLLRVYTWLRVTPVLETVSREQVYQGDEVEVSLSTQGAHLSKGYTDGTWKQNPTKITLSLLKGSLSLEADPDMLPADAVSQSTFTARLIGDTGMPLVGETLVFSLEGGGYLRDQDGNWITSPVARQTAQDGTASVEYRVDGEAGLVYINVSTLEGQRTSRFALIKIPDLGSGPYSLHLESENCELTLGSSINLTATYLVQGTGEPGREVHFIVVPEAGSLDPSSGSTGDEGKLQTIYTAPSGPNAEPQRISIIAYSFDNETFVADRIYLNLLALEGNTLLQIPDEQIISISGSDSLGHQSLKFRLTEDQTQGLSTGVYRVSIVSSGSYSRNNRPWLWGENINFNFTILAADEGADKILSIEPNFGYQGDNNLGVTIIGGRDTVFGSQSVVTFAPSSSGESYENDFPGRVTALVKSTKKEGGLSIMLAELNIDPDAVPGWWNVEVTSPDRIQTYSMEGDEDFEVRPQGGQDYLMVLKADPNILVAGSKSQSTITARLFQYLYDQHQLKPLSNWLIEFSRSGDNGTFVGGSQRWTNSQGLAETQYEVGTDTTSTLITILASAKEGPDSEAVISRSVEITKLIDSEIDPGKSSVTAIPSEVPAHGSDYSLVTVTVLNQYSLPLPGKEVALSYSGDILVFVRDQEGNNVNSLTTDENGQVFFYLRSREIGTITVVASVGDIVLNDKPEVTFVSIDELKEYTLRATVSFEAKSYDEGKVWVIIKNKIRESYQVDEVYWVGDDNLIRDGEGELLKVQLRPENNYVIWVKGEYHKAQAKDFVAPSANNDEPIDLIVPKLLAGDLAGTSPPGRTGFHDNQVSTPDFSFLLNFWGQDTRNNSEADKADIGPINSLDHFINTFDFAVLLKNWLNGAPKP